MKFKITKKIKSEFILTSKKSKWQSTKIEKTTAPNDLTTVYENNEKSSKTSKNIPTSLTCCESHVKFNKSKIELRKISLQ